MQCFFIQFKCNLGRAYDVAATLAEREIASEVYSTSGEYDLLAKFYLEKDTDIGHFVNEHIHPIEGVERTLTTLTFKAF
ncbi:MAG: Lrp/AsnC ligand binding domain-containing protein [Rhizobiaceae bacterium]|nr:Lrp/AsnC ligand binding domain-containing protein [Rhizobiaceae bacterium]